VGGGVAAPLERGLLGGFLAGLLAAGLLAALNGLAPVQHPLTFGLVFAHWYALAGLIAGLLAAFAVSMLARLARRPALARGLLAAAALASVLLLLLANGPALRALSGLAGPGRFRLLLPAALGCAVAGLLSAALLPLERRGPLRGLALAAAAASLGALAPAGSSSRPPPELPAARTRSQAQPLFLIGLDGADWRYLDPLMARGELPHLAAVKARGAWGRLQTYEPTLSPVIWTSVITGRVPADHGIQSFAVPRLRGVFDPLPQLRPVRAAGFGALTAWLTQNGQLGSSPISGRLRRVPAYWNLATSQGAPVNVVNWWATWPAEPVLGAMVSERVYYRPLRDQERAVSPGGVTWPDSLLSELAPLLVRPSQVGFDTAAAFMDVTPEEFASMQAGRFPAKSLGAQFGYFWAMFETDRKVALYLIDASRRRFGALADLVLLLRLIDMTGHTSLQHSELVSDHLGARPEELRKFGRVVSQAYRAVDAAVGQILDAAGPDANVLIVSDHGFRLERAGGAEGEPYYGHGRAPDGILLAAGPAFRPGRVEGVTVYDVLPLMAAVKGFPVASDLAGTLRADLLDPVFAQAHPVVRVASYGARAGSGTLGEAGAADQEMLERLRGLGYIQ
jgi:hypothetical protein